MFLAYTLTRPTLYDGECSSVTDTAVIIRIRRYDSFTTRWLFTCCQTKVRISFTHANKCATHTLWKHCSLQYEHNNLNNTLYLPSLTIANHRIALYPHGQEIFLVRHSMCGGKWRGGKTLKTTNPTIQWSMFDRTKKQTYSLAN